eukprot:765191-Hanusia_phi.AAC.2
MSSSEDAMSDQRSSSQLAESRFGSYAKFRELYSAVSKSGANLKGDRWGAGRSSNNSSGRVDDSADATGYVALHFSLLRNMKAQSSHTPRIRAVLTDLLQQEGPA